MTHAEYMREWRTRHPEYVQKDREQSRARQRRSDPARRRRNAERMHRYRGTAAGMLTDLRRQTRRRLDATEG